MNFNILKHVSAGNKYAYEVKNTRRSKRLRNCNNVTSRMRKSLIKIIHTPIKINQSVQKTMKSVKSKLDICTTSFRKPTGAIANFRSSIRCSLFFISM